MATTGVGIVVQPLWVCHRGAGAHAQKGAESRRCRRCCHRRATMTAATVAHQQLTYLTFISVREVDRCAGS